MMKKTLYEIENELYWTMFDCQKLLLALHETDRLEDAIDAIRQRVLAWREDVGQYMTAPEWDEGGE